MHQQVLGLCPHCLLDRTQSLITDFCSSSWDIFVLLALQLQMLRVVLFSMGFISYLYQAVPFSTGFTSCLCQDVSVKPCLLSSPTSTTASGKLFAILLAVFVTSALVDVE